MPKEKKTTDLRAVQGHQEVGGIARTFQELTDHVRIIGPIVYKRSNLVPWAAPVEQVPPRTAYHFKMPYRVLPDQDTSMVMEWGGVGDTEQNGARDAFRPSGSPGKGRPAG